MAKIIDHTARRHQIITESLKLFAAFGYAQVNFGMIAKSCGVARTILYTYFKDKRSIFNEAIDEVTEKIRSSYHSASDLKMKTDEKLRQVCFTVLSVMFENRDFICVISDVLINCRRKGVAIPVERIKAHTEGLVKVLRRFLSEGYSNGDLKLSLNIENLANVFYSQFEAAALRIAVTGNADYSTCVNEMDALIKTLH